MANTHTTPASVASRLTDEEIEHLAQAAKQEIQFWEAADAAAAVLRDYMRLRRHKLRMIKPHLCTECSHWSDSGCEVGGCADFNEKEEAK